MIQDAVTVRAPAKLILSGEHSVVYGAPALVMSIDRELELSIRRSHNEGVAFNCADLQYNKTLTIVQLQDLKQRIEAIRVLKNPVELLQYAYARFAAVYMDKLLSVEISCNSAIPVGYGMGSSAAAIVALLCAMIAVFKLDVPMEDYLQICREIENLQHGKSSGIDIAMVVNGGCLHYKGGEIVKVLAPQFPMYLVNTGRPQTTTRDCVLKTATMFKDKGLLEEFAEVTKCVETSLNNLEEFKRNIKLNHRLLTRIGVVPEKVQKFVTRVEEMGGAAKICGAGSFAGDNAGAVLVISEANVAEVAAKYGYSMTPINCHQQGVYVV